MDDDKEKRFFPSPIRRGKRKKRKTKPTEEGEKESSERHALDVGKAFLKHLPTTTTAADAAAAVLIFA